MIQKLNFIKNEMRVNSNMKFWPFSEKKAWTFIEKNLTLIRYFLIYIIICFFHFGCNRSEKPDYEIEVVHLDKPYITYNEPQIETLHYDFHRPKGLNEKLPLILMIHSGGFLIGNKNNHFISTLRNDLVKKGFATASINYRLIDLPTSKEDLYKTLDSRKSVIFQLIDNHPQKYLKLEIYDAIRDARAAVRYFKTHSGDLEINIDPNKIFVVGYSAGAIIALNLAFLEDEEAQHYFGTDQKKCLDCDIMGIHDAVKGNVQGVVAVAGGVFDINHLNGESSTPLLLIHGNQDDMVPYGSGKPFTKYVGEDLRIDLPKLALDLRIFGEQDNPKSSSIEISESLVVPSFMMESIRDVLSPELFGSQAIRKNLGRKKCQLITIKGANHSFMWNKNGTLGRSYDRKVRDPIICFLKKHTKTNRNRKR